MIGRIIWFAALLVIAAVTTALQIDKQSEVVPALAPLVPPPLRNFAQTQIAAAAADGGDPAVALEEARKLVRRRPVPAEYLTLLAVAQTKAGQGEAAGLTIQIAGQRGWREPLAQESVLRLAVAAGDKPEAARRYAALFLNASTSDELLRELGPPVLAETDGPGQRTLVDIITGTERWNTVFLRRGSQVIAPEAMSDIVVATIARGTVFDCDALARTAKALGLRDQLAAKRVSDAGKSRCPALQSR